MQCKKCKSVFPCHPIIDGKKVNLQNRKYCLICSPFKQHNTKILTNDTSIKEKVCKTCGKLIVRKVESKGKNCWSCANKKSRIDKIVKIQELVGKYCWFCYYGKCWSALEFHHINPEDKLIGLSTRELQYSWERIEQEVKKCILVCANCHREIHYNLINEIEVINKWKNHWKIQ